VSETVSGYATPINEVQEALHMCWEGRRTFTCDPTVSRRGRAFCSQHLSAVLDISAASGYIEDADLVISELLTNAANAGCTDTQLLINLHHDHIRITVSDNGAGWPEMQRPAPDQRHGRGLQIVDHIAAGWGVRATIGSGKEVWADVAIAPDLTDGIDCHV
jgi:anti-sigma regulatory factor (Ser/Thr protein kinase)